MTLENFSWIIPGKLAGSAMPGGYVHASVRSMRRDVAFLREQGIRCIVSLERMPDTFKEICAEHECEWVYFGIEDFGAPADMTAFDQFVNTIIKKMETGIPVCVHCRAGVGRTGLVLACVVGRSFGIGSKQAVETVRRTRRLLESDEQSVFVKEYLDVFCTEQTQ